MVCGGAELAGSYKFFVEFNHVRCEYSVWSPQRIAWKLANDEAPHIYARNNPRRPRVRLAADTRESNIHVVDSVVPLSMTVRTQSHRILDGIFPTVCQRSAMMNLKVRSPV